MISSVQMLECSHDVSNSTLPLRNTVSGVRLAYLINQYPMTSLTFIRREITALERSGQAVQRYTIRRSPDELVDDDDIADAHKTRVLLEAGWRQFLFAVLVSAIRSPWCFAKAAWTAWGMGRRAGATSKHLIYLVEACLLKNWCDQDQIQHLHSHFGTNSTVVAMLCSVLGGPRYSFTVHGPEEFDRPERLSLKEKIGGAKFVVGVSSFGRSQLYRWCPFQQWPKVRVVRCGLPADYLEGPPPAPVTSRRLVCVGRLHEQKGTLLLLQAVALLAAQGSRFEITLVGDGPMRTDVEEFIRRRQLQSIVKLVGWQSGYEVREHLLASRAMVMPSFAEGLPVACMEALAMGRPVVATYIAGIPELIVPGRCGWLVPAGSVSALATAISEVLDASLDTLADMGHFGWQRVREFHDVRRETRKLCGFFSEEKQWADQ